MRTTITLPHSRIKHLKLHKTHKNEKNQIIE